MVMIYINCERGHKTLGEAFFFLDQEVLPKTVSFCGGVNGILPQVISPQSIGYVSKSEGKAIPFLPRNKT